MLIFTHMHAHGKHLGSLHIAHGGNPLDVLALQDICCVLQRQPDRHSVAHVGPSVPHHRNTRISCTMTHVSHLHATVCLLTLLHAAIFQSSLRHSTCLQYVRPACNMKGCVLRLQNRSTQCSTCIGRRLPGWLRCLHGGCRRIHFWDCVEGWRAEMRLGGHLHISSKKCSSYLTILDHTILGAK